jgi:hypothetical protein
MMGVASNILKEERVFAIGISFFLSVNPKPIVNTDIRDSGYVWNNLNDSIDKMPKYLEYYTTCCNNSSKGDNSNVNNISLSSLTNNKYPLDLISEDKYCMCCEISSTIPGASAASASSVKFQGSTNINTINRKLKSAKLSKSLNHNKEVKVKKMEVGAGANIKQSIFDDPEPLEFWRKEPEAIICINYCDEESTKKILDSGKIDMEGDPESFLKDIPKGNKKLTLKEN